MCPLQDVCVKKDFDDLYNKMTDGGRQLKVIHGGVVEVTYQPVKTTRDITFADHPFGITQLPAPETQTPTEQDTAAPTHEDAQVRTGFICGW